MLTDHISLKYLLEQRLTHTLQHKGLCKLLGLDYTIQYKRGVDNKVADALSRRETVHDMELYNVSTRIPSWVTDLRQSYEGDEWASEVKEKLEKGEEARSGVLGVEKEIKKNCTYPFP
jgi:hypothetical protein